MNFRLLGWEIGNYDEGSSDGRPGFRVVCITILEEPA